VGLAAMSAEEFPQTLKRRLTAMKTMKPISRNRAILAGITLAVAGVTLILPWRVVAQTDPHLKKEAKKQSEPQPPLTFDMVSNKLQGMQESLLKLNLTDEQKTRIQTLFTETQNRLQQVFAQEGLSDEERAIQSKMALGSAFEAANSLLTPEQREKTFVKKEVKTGGDPVERVTWYLLSEKASFQPEKDGSGRLAKLALTPGQQSQLQAVIEQGRRQMEIVQNDSTLPKVEMKTRLSDIAKSFEGQLLAILTPEQMKRLILISSPVEKRSDPYTEIAAQLLTAHDADAAQALNEAQLNPDQQTQMFAVIQQGRQLMQAIMNDKTLSPEQRKQNANRVIDESKNRFQGLLASEQVKRLYHALSLHEPQFPSVVEGAMGLPDLSEDQRTHLQAIIADWKQRLGSVHRDKTTSLHEKNDLIDQTDAWGGQQLRSVLTAEQNSALTATLQRPLKKKKAAVARERKSVK
jgi:hypothetical protein